MIPRIKCAKKPYDWSIFITNQDHLNPKNSDSIYEYGEEAYYFKQFKPRPDGEAWPLGLYGEVGNSRFNDGYVSIVYSTHPVISMFKESKLFNNYEDCVQWMIKCLITMLNKLSQVDSYGVSKN